ncbi:hypothetical protein QYF61_004522, partial [Mycteria americana]
MQIAPQVATMFETLTLSVSHNRTRATGHKLCTFTSGVHLAITVYQGCIDLLKPGHSPNRLAKYQAVLLEQDDIVISLTSALNPATLLISEKMMEILLEKLHQETHSGADALVLIAKRHIIGPKMQSLVDIIVKKCAICCANKPKIAKKIMGGIVKQGITPGEYWQIDFTELPRCNLYKYLLTPFSGWPEAFPSRTNKAREVIKVLLKEIIPRFGVPEGISSDNGPHFIAEIVQGVSRFLDMPQSSGKVERMNQTLKRQISEVCQETQMKWGDQIHLSHFNLSSLIHLLVVLMFLSGLTLGNVSIYVTYFYNKVLYSGSNILPQCCSPD